jgi:hypothetical protein
MKEFAMGILGLCLVVLMLCVWASMAILPVVGLLYIFGWLR